jgi:dienelactone hydrolase
VSYTTPSGNGQVPAGVTDPATTGPNANSSSTGLTYTDPSNNSVTYDLYYPTTAPAGPVVLVSHGFAQSGADFANWGILLASWGYVAIVPSWSSIDSTSAPGDATLANELLAYAVSQSASNAQSPIYGKVDGTRQALLGHSAGGLMVFLAAAQNPAVHAVVGLDPVDDSTGNAPGSAATAALSIHAFTAILQSDPSSCNNDNSDQACLYDDLPGPKFIAQVANSNHCDCEDPADFLLCETVCGSATAPQQAEFKRYALAALFYALSCDSAVVSWIDGPAVQADTLLTGYASAAVACPGPIPDGG